MARLSEEIIQAAQQTKEKRSRLETARRAREETAAAVQANIDACMDAFALASAVHTAAVEHHTAMKAAVQRLKEHVTTRTSAVALAEVELETRQAAVASQEVESAQAIEMGRQAESALRVEKAALDSYTQDVTRDAKAHEMEVRKANERIATTTALRELRVASVVAERRLHNTWRMREEGSQLPLGTSHSWVARTRSTEGPSGRT